MSSEILLSRGVWRLALHIFPRQGVLVHVSGPKAARHAPTRADLGRHVGQVSLQAPRTYLGAQHTCAAICGGERHLAGAAGALQARRGGFKVATQ